VGGKEGSGQGKSEGKRKIRRTTRESDGSRDRSGLEAGDGSEEGESEREEEGSQGRWVHTKEQADLVRRAFASVDVAEDFAHEKSDAIAEEEAEAEAAAARKKGGKHGGAQMTAMPGWGSWAGPGASAPPFPTVSANKRAAPKMATGERKENASSLPPTGRNGMMGSEGGGGRQEVAGVSGSTTVDKALVKPRLDRALPTVLINERRVKKTAVLKVAQVPYPFTSREQYERSLRRPIGKEWNTTTAVREETRPAVKVRAGFLVEPIKLRKTHRAVFPKS
jgi:U3 small nucleolar RNA-associated protein 14